MATDRELLKQQQTGVLGTFGAIVDPTGTVGALHSDAFVFDKSAADGAASTATSATDTGIYLPVKYKVKSIVFVPTSGGITADASNYATVTVSSYDGSTTTALGTLTTTVASSGNLTQGVGKAFVLTAANAIVAAGLGIRFAIAKTGTGVVVPAGRFTIYVEAV